MDISNTSLLVEPAWRNTTFDEAELAAVAYLARYRGRTLDAYRLDLKGFFSWAEHVAQCHLRA